MLIHFKNLFTFICGVGMFLYGMKLMSEGLQKVAGTKFTNIVKALTTNKFTAILVGALVTAILHSSGATTVMVVGFVNAGIMKLTEAVGVIMGANIGTTITAWIVSLTQLGSVMAVFEPSFYAPAIFGFSALVIVFSMNEKVRNKANIFLGLGLLFLGLTYMASGVKYYSDSKVFVDAFVILGNNPILAILVGAIVTIILSSSTASVSILQTLALAGSVSKGAACFITVGQNIGTCVTTIISSLKSSKNGKRAALLHLLFNVIGGFVFSILVFISYPLVKNLLATKISLVEISIFHTGFNILNTLLLLPFSNLLVSITKKVIPDGNDEEVEFDLTSKTSAILDERLLAQPSVALETVRQEVLFYANYTLKNLKRATNLILHDRNEDLVRSVVEHEEQIDKTTEVLIGYLMKINNLNITEAQLFEVETLLSMCNDVERIGDHAENISEEATELVENNAKFSENGIKELENYISIALKSVEKSIYAITNDSIEAVNEVRECEDLADKYEDEYRNSYIKRLGSNGCDSVAGIVFLDVIGNLERVADHANNIADEAEAEINYKNGKV